MSSILVRKASTQKNKFAGRSWFYPYRELNLRLKEDKCRLREQALAYRFASITKDWSAELNSEWMCRVYLAAKMILSATLHLNSMKYAEEKNLRVVVPYLRYYALLSLARGVAYTLPEHNWDEGALITLSHSKASQYTTTYLSGFDTEVGKTFHAMFLELKAARELISYRAPSSGDRGLGNYEHLDWMFVLLSEIIQFNSEIMESSILKNASAETFEVIPSYIDRLSHVSIENRTFFDSEDSQRLHYLKKRHPVPPNVLHAMTEGHVDDFYGAWCSNVSDSFDPDENWGRIFDLV